MMTVRPRILILSWRDIHSKGSGGAEIYTHEIFSRLVDYQVDHLSPAHAGHETEEIIDNIRYLRRGNALTVIAYARLLIQKTDYMLIIDQINTHRFFTPLWLANQQFVTLIHQLTREIWHYNLPSPFSYIGAWSENLMLKLYCDMPVITVSQSTAQELYDLGFKQKQVHIVPNGFIMPTVPLNVSKRDKTFVYLGRFSPYKGLDHALQAFAILKDYHSDAQIWLIGSVESTVLETQIMPFIDANHLTIGEGQDSQCDVILWGYVDEQKKTQLLAEARALIFPAVREGWGRTISEAALCGTPSIVYNSQGVIDAVNYGQAGFVAEKGQIESLTQQMKIAIENEVHYQIIRKNALEFTQKLTWDYAVDQMQSTLNQIITML